MQLIVNVIILGLGLLLFTACQEKKGSTTIAPPQTYFPMTVDGQKFRIQLALTTQEQQEGLMHRQEMAEDEGMLFVFEDWAKRSFWMKNTLIPLDILYFNDAGQVEEMYPMYPLNERSVPSQSDQIVMALELNQGVAQKYNFKRGSQLSLEALADALRRRGSPLSSYKWARKE